MSKRGLTRGRELVGLLGGIHRQGKEIDSGWHPVQSQEITIAIIRSRSSCCAGVYCASLQSDHVGLIADACLALWLGCQGDRHVRHSTTNT